MTVNFGPPKEKSVFDSRTVQDIYEEVRKLYKSNPQPWVIGYSGGKDSTAVLQLVWKALEGLPAEEREKPVLANSAPLRSEYLQ
jgi:DNA sulfur modification protein DndC